MPDFGIFRGFNEKLFGDKLYAGQLPTQLGLIGSEDFGFTGLLDTYTGAAAAYSLRLLRTAYTGSAIEVRVNTTGQPTYDIGFVDGELDTATLEGYCTGGLDAFVTTWYDQSGNGYDATQTTAANQPQIVSSGSVILENGKPLVKGNDNTDFLVITNSITKSSNTSIFLTSYIDTSSNIFVSLANGSGAYFLLVQGNSTSTTVNSQVGTPTIFLNSNSYTTTTRRDAYNDFQGQNLFSLINGSTQNLNPFNIGYGIGLNMFNYQEIIIYNSDQSSNRSGIETNINDFYSIY